MMLVSTKPTSTTPTTPPSTSTTTNTQSSTKTVTADKSEGGPAPVNIWTNIIGLISVVVLTVISRKRK